MRQEMDDPLMQHELRERWSSSFRGIAYPLAVEHFADGTLETKLDLRRFQAVAVLGSYVRPSDPNDPSSDLVPSPLTRGRLVAGVFCLRPWMTLVLCGRNLDNEQAISDAEVLANTAREEFGVQNPVIPLPQGFTTAGEMVSLSKTARDNEWNNVVVVTNPVHVERAASMAYSLKLIDISEDIYLEIGTYLKELWEKKPNRRNDVDALLNSFESLAFSPYRGSFTFVSPVEDRGKPIKLNKLMEEHIGARLWRTGRYH